MTEQVRKNQKRAAALLLFAALCTGLFSCAAKESDENKDGENSVNEENAATVSDDDTAQDEAGKTAAEESQSDAVWFVKGENGYSLFDSRTQKSTEIDVPEEGIDEHFLTADGNTVVWYTSGESLYRLKRDGSEGGAVKLCDSVGDVLYFPEDFVIYRDIQSKELYAGSVYAPELVDRDVRRYCTNAIRSAEVIAYEKRDGGSYIKKSGAQPELVCTDPARIRTVVSDGSVVYTADGSEGDLVRYYGNGREEVLYAGAGDQELEELLYFTDDFSEYTFETDDESLYRVKNGERTLIASGPLEVETDADDGTFFYKTFPYGNEDIGDLYFFDGEKANFAFGFCRSIDEEEKLTVGDTTVTVYSRSVTEDEEGDNNIVLSDGKSVFSFACDDYCDAFASGDMVYICDRSGVFAVSYRDGVFSSPERTADFPTRAKSSDFLGTADGKLLTVMSDENGCVLFADEEKIGEFAHIYEDETTKNAVYFATYDEKEGSCLYRCDGKGLQKLLSAVADHDLESDKDTLYCIADAKENGVGTLYRIVDGQEPQAVLKDVRRFETAKIEK